MTVVYHPRLAMGCDRINALAREANIAAESQPVNTYTDPRIDDEVARYENYRTAKTVLRSPEWYGADVVHAALDFVHEYENAIPKASPETPEDVLASMQHRLPEIMIAAGIVATAILASTGWIF